MSKQAFKRLRKRLGFKVTREPLENFSWPGGYDIVYCCGDGGVLCGDCACLNIDQIDAAIRDQQTRDQWYVHAVMNGDELEQNLRCDHCGYSMGPEEDELSRGDDGPEPMYNPLGFSCPPNGTCPDVVSESNFKRFVAWGVLRSWVPMMVGDERDTMPLAVAHECHQQSRLEYHQQSRLLRQGFLNCLGDAVKACADGDIKAGRTSDWEPHKPSITIRLEGNIDLDAAWRFERLDDDDAMLFILESSTDAGVSHGGRDELMEDVSWLDMTSFASDPASALAYLAKAEVIIGSDHD